MAALPSGGGACELKLLNIKQGQTMVAENLKPFAFILMPFDDDFNDIYKLGIQATASELGIIAERVDEQTYTESILERIYRQIAAADFIIADMSGRNPNVFYEVGYAHALNKLCTLVTKNAEDIPFDLKHHRHLVYSGSIQKLKSLLRTEMTWLLSEREKRRTSTLTIELKRVNSTLDADKWQAHVETEIKLDIHNHSALRSPEIEAIYLYTGPNWDFSVGSDKCPSTEAQIDGKSFDRHFIKSPVNRLSPSAWAQLNIIGRKRVWAKYLGEEKKETYRLRGLMRLEIATAEGNIGQDLYIDTTADEIPF